MLSLVCIKSGASLVPLGQIRPHSYSLPCTAFHCISVLERLSSWEAVGLGNWCAISGFASVCTQSCHFKCGGQLFCLYAVEIIRCLEEITTPQTKENITWNLYVFV